MKSKKTSKDRSLQLITFVILFLPFFSLIILSFIDKRSSSSEIVHTSAVVGLFSVAFYSFVFDASKYLFGKKRRSKDNDD